MGLNAAQRGRRNRRKGHDFERDVAKRHRDCGFVGAKRGLQTREGGEAPDVDGTPYWIECKAGARPNIVGAYQQAVAATDGRPVVIWTKQDRKETLVTVSVKLWYATIRHVVHADDEPYWIAYASSVRPNITGVHRRAVAATDGRPVLVWTRYERGETLVTLEADLWLATLRHVSRAERRTNDSKRTSAQHE